jgi:hypothetical protein
LTPFCELYVVAEAMGIKDYLKVLEAVAAEGMAASGAKPTFGRICTSLEANNRYPSEHNNVVTLKRQIALLLIRIWPIRRPMVCSLQL